MIKLHAQGEEMQADLELRTVNVGGNNIEVHGYDEEGTDLGSLGDFVGGEGGGFRPAVLSGRLREFFPVVEGDGAIAIVPPAGEVGGEGGGE